MNKLHKYYEVIDQAIKNDTYFRAVKDCYELMQSEGFGKRSFKKMIEGIESLREDSDANR